MDVTYTHKHGKNCNTMKLFLFFTVRFVKYYIRHNFYQHFQTTQNGFINNKKY